MHNFIWLIATAVLTLGLPIASLAQDDRKTGVAYSRYDKSKNETTIEAQRLEVGKTSDQQFVLNAAVVVPGEKLVRRPDDVMLIIQIVSPSYRYPDVMDVKLRVDGNKMSPIKMVTLDRRASDKLFVETIGTRIPYSSFKSLAMAKEVEFAVDKTTITVGPAHLTILADLDKMLNP